MAITYFQDTIFKVDTTLTAPGGGATLKVAENNFFATKDYTLITVVANINTNVIVRLDGSIDGTNFAPIITNKTITTNGSHINHVRMPVKWVRPWFVSESGGTAADVTFHIAAL
jgi:hypothetical protein